MNVLKLLSNDHEGVRALIRKFDKAGRNAHDRRLAIFEELRLEIQLHSRVEEEIFYPVIKAISEAGRELASQALKEHRDVDQLLTQISRLRPHDPKFSDRVEALIETVDSHIDEEEREMFRFVEENCPEDQLTEMAAEILKRKKALERQLAA